MTLEALGDGVSELRFLSGDECQKGPHRRLCSLTIPLREAAKCQPLHVLFKLTLLSCHLKRKRKEAKGPVSLKI